MVNYARDRARDSARDTAGDPPETAPAPSLAVHAHGLTVVRGGRTVLDALGFDVPQGQITGLLGPSGCGKTTLMRAIAGTQAKVAGTLDVLGAPAGHPRLRPRIGYVTQAPSVYDDLTVRQNLDYFAAVLQPGPAARAERRAAVTRAIEDVDLTDHADVLAAHLSGGQRSRVSLAVALLGDPELLVLDEPTVGLDPVLRRDLWNLFHTLAARGTTLLVSSHVMDEADRCHRLLLLRDGRLLAEGTPESLRARTHSATVEEAFLHLAAGPHDLTPDPRTPEATEPGTVPVDAAPVLAPATAPAPATAADADNADADADPDADADAGRPAGRRASAARTTATAARVLRQLRHDPRTIALMLLVPCAMIALLRYVFDASPRTFDGIGASLLGIFPMITMFLVTSIATLRERTSGTLERLLALPLGKADLIGGYALAFGLLAIVQSALATALSIGLLGLDVTGSPWLLLLVAVLDALLGTALGLFVSAFAASEFQAVQFMPAVLMPQLLLCGLFTARDTMQPALKALSDVLPMSYAVDGMDQVRHHADATPAFVHDTLIVTACALLVLTLGAATLRRRTP
ncbi:ABC transporter permease [Streptomyces sp. GS7]|nr:ABC transporter permease [Streptomyces sp. GS7]